TWVRELMTIVRATRRTPLLVTWVSILLGSDCLLGSGREPVRLFCPVELVEELEPLTREAVFREMQRLELRVVRDGLFALRHHRLRACRRGRLRRGGGGGCRGSGGRAGGRRGVCAARSWALLVG